MMNTRLVLCLAGLGLTLGCQPSHTASDQPLPAAGPIALDIPRGCVPAGGSPTDASTGLPLRLLHQASGITLVLISPGEFDMGASHVRRTIGRPFYMGTTEVTAAQFRRFVDATGYRTDAEQGTWDGQGAVGGFAAMPTGDRKWNAATSWRNPWPNLADPAPGFQPADDYPVVHASWNDAKAFCAHFGLHLPSEARWEYACRAGSDQKFPWGEDAAAGAGLCNVQDEAYGRRLPGANGMFPFDDGYALLAPAGQTKPNAWGLHDMIGNLEEWCEDDWHRHLALDAADDSPVVGSGKRAEGRALRGGSWLGDAGICNAISRPSFVPAGRRDFIGFRVVADVICR